MGAVTKAITIDEPFPALVVAGIKGWETRGNPPAGEMCPAGVRPLPGCAIERGERIAIHASARLPLDVDALKASGLHLGEWSMGPLRHVGVENEYDCERCPDPEDGNWDPECWALNRFDPALLRDEGAHGWSFVAWLPTSAVVCTARVVDALPIIDAHLGWTGEGDTPPGAVLVSTVYDSLGVVTGVGTGDDVTDYIEDQLPYGHWEPGGWAWELDDVEPLAGPIPCRGRQGVWRLPEDVAEEINR